MPKAPVKKAAPAKSPKASPQRQNAKPDPTKAAKKAAKKNPKPQSERPVIYPEYDARILVGENELTAAQAKELIGWESEEDYYNKLVAEAKEAGREPPKDPPKFGADFLLVDEYGNKVRCWNNVSNRPFDKGLAKTWQSEILQMHWKFNGESMIIGKTGITVACQHRLAGLILAVQAWERDREKWSEWETEPTMPALIVFGVDEDDDTVNTIDTGKPRSLADVLARSEYFAGMVAKDRNNCASIAAYAIKTLGHRTGAWLDAFAPRRTHAESLDFLNRHPRLLECVKHIYEEDEDGKISKQYVRPGYAAALMYFMGSAATKQSEYYEADPPSEELLDWSLWDNASDFWVLLASGDSSVSAVKNVLAGLHGEDGSTPSVAEQIAVVLKAWICLVDGKPINTKSVSPKYHTDDDGVRHLTECPTAGGIDRGNPSEDDDDIVVEPDPSPEEIEGRAAEVRVDTKTKKATGKGKPLGSIKIGETVWVTDGDAPWRGKLIHVRNVPHGKVATVEVASGFAGAGTEIDVPFGKVQSEQPIAA